MYFIGDCDFGDQKTEGRGKAGRMSQNKDEIDDSSLSPLGPSEKSFNRSVRSLHLRGQVEMKGESMYLSAPRLAPVGVGESNLEDMTPG